MLYLLLMMSCSKAVLLLASDLGIDPLLKYSKATAQGEVNVRVDGKELPGSLHWIVVGILPEDLKGLVVDVVESSRQIHAVARGVEVVEVGLKRSEQWYWIGNS